VRSRHRCLTAAAAAALPALCHGHAFGERYDLPAPLPYFVAGAALTVALSFIVIAWAARGSLGRHIARSRPILLGTLLPVLARALQAFSVFLLLLVLVAGAFGHVHPSENIAPTFVWVIWWVGLSLFAACVGNPWPALDPWRAIFEATDECARRLGATRGIALGKPYPAALGAWPAVFLLLVFAWIEVVLPNASAPARISACAGAWTLVTLAGMLWFGREQWQRYADPFAICFDLLGRFAPVAATPDVHVLVLRWPGSGLLAPHRMSTALVAFIVAMLATVLFDGLLGTQLWRVFDRTLSRWLPQLIDRDDLYFGTLGLVLTWGVLLGAYLVTCFVTARLLRERGTLALAQLFGLSLVPIAIGYNVAHNFSYFLEQSRWIIPLASDPFGRDWNLFGTARYQVVLGFADARFTWYVAISAIVSGHVVSIWVAHRLALGAFVKRQRAVVASAPLTALMVGYTALSLTIIAEPLVQFRTPDPSYSRHDARGTATADLPGDRTATPGSKKRIDL